MPVISRDFLLPLEDADSSAEVLPVRHGELPPTVSVPAYFCKNRLWLCLHFPQLPLEISATPDGAPQAVLTTDERKPLVLLCNDAAAARGVRSGMPVNAALALLPDIVLRSRELSLELDALTGLATWARRFTPACRPAVSPTGWAGSSTRRKA